jgi:protein involved in polysaccharide export with SLBB domain
MQFELLPGETAQDALRFAGRLLPNAYAGGLTLRRQDASGETTVLDLAMGDLGGCALQAGDVLSALPRRDRLEALVYVVGWARVPGAFARTEGLRVGELLKRQAQVMPDTYLYRADIIRTQSDGSTRFLAFDVAKALAGEPSQNLPLENRDRVRLYRVNRLRLPRQVILSGPFTQAGVYELHEGMRVADLLFLAGIPQKKANRLEAELARSRSGLPSEVRKVDLARLLSTEAGSPVALADEALNPLLQDDDQVTVYEKPEFRVHRKVRISGQVAKPGLYVLDVDRPTLSQLIQRAGGLTAEAMPKAGILLRSFEFGTDPTVKGINDILGRLNETKLLLEKAANPSEASRAALFRPPVLHSLGETRLNRIVVDFEGALKGNRDVDTEVLDGDEIIIPRVMDTANVVGETSSPFGSYKVRAGMKVADLLDLAGGTTRNADTWNIRLVKADGRILDSWVKHKPVEPGDTLIVPQRFRRESNWQENLTALTSVGLILNALAASGHL